tara:strand:- start:8384 stop:8494 length:111 start_codon:yes stop_codon:yes gene_type:complete
MVVALKKDFMSLPEIFARNTHPGWGSWGNEIEKYDT